MDVAFPVEAVSRWRARQWSEIDFVVAEIDKKASWYHESRYNIQHGQTYKRYKYMVMRKVPYYCNSSIKIAGMWERRLQMCT